ISSGLSQGREKEEENLDFFPHRGIRRSVSPCRTIRHLQAISSPRAGRRNVSPREENERGNRYAPVHTARYWIPYRSVLDTILYQTELSMPVRTGLAILGFNFFCS
ncbi:hypothetical protein GW17_00061246, partial [Ensete ventricosum]